MKEFIEKLIERLEELADGHAYCHGDTDYQQGIDNGTRWFKQEAISIVNELAGEYINTSTDTSTECNKTLDSLHKKILSNPKMCEIVTEEEIMALVEAKNNGWIPCSERLPEEPFGCLVTVMDCEPMTQTDFENILPYHVGYDGEAWNDADGNVIPFEVIAWQPLPAPYKEGE